MLIKIYDKDEDTKPVLFTIDFFEKDKKWVVEAVKDIIDRVWKKDGYTTDDLRKALNEDLTGGVYPILRYDFEERKEVIIPF